MACWSFTKGTSQVVVVADSSAAGASLLASTAADFSSTSGVLVAGASMISA